MLVKTNPAALKVELTQLGQEEPDLLSAINHNQAEFLKMMNQSSKKCPKNAHEVTQLVTNDESSQNTPPDECVPDNPPIDEELEEEKTMRQEWESFSKMRDGTVKVAIAQGWDMKKRTAFLKIDMERRSIGENYLSHKDGKTAKTHVVMKKNKKYVFEYGMVDLPAELSCTHFVGTYS